MVPVATDAQTKQVVHYIVSHSSPDRLGATKLNKVLWRADVEHYRQFGATITQHQFYRRMPFGPVLETVHGAIAELVAENKVVTRETHTPSGLRHEFIGIERASTDGFTAAQIEILQESIRIVCSRSAKQASDDTHDPLWEEIENGSNMPVRAASVCPASLEPDDITWAIEAAASLHD